MQIKAVCLGPVVYYKKKLSADKLVSSIAMSLQNVVDVAFGDMTYKWNSLQKTSIKTFGISQLTAKQTGSSYMAMAVGMGMARDSASDMAIELTSLSADLASIYTEEARTAFWSETMV